MASEFLLGRQMFLKRKLPVSVEDEDGGLQFGRKCMKVLAKLFIMESYHKYGGFNEGEKNDRGIRQKKCSDYMAEESKLVNNFC